MKTAHPNLLGLPFGWGGPKFSRDVMSISLFAFTKVNIDPIPARFSASFYLMSTVEHGPTPFQFHRSNIDDLVKSPKSLFFVIPAKAGIQYFHKVTKNLDPVFQRGDDFLRDRQH
jgi:hypothetical protein